MQEWLHERSKPHILANLPTFHLILIFNISFLVSVICLGSIAVCTFSGHLVAALVASTAYLGLNIAFMAILASFILFKTKWSCGRAFQSTHQIGQSRSMDEFQVLVAIVAIAFCLCLLPVMINMTHYSIYFEGNAFLSDMAAFFNVMNSSVNFVIYSIVSRRFRRACRRFWRSFICPRSREG